MRFYLHLREEPRNLKINIETCALVCFFEICLLFSLKKVQSDN